MRQHTTAVCGLVLALTTGGCGPDAPKQIEAGGSTFAYPMMSRWASEYEKAKGVGLRYYSIGSGQGIEQLIDRKVDFGCTDGPMSEAELSRARTSGGEVLHIPLMMGAVVPVYNLPGLKQPLRFTGQVLAEIFLGKITRWNDKALKFLNPDAELPDTEIATVHRLDSSGTTYVWTDYLSAVNPQWKAELGVGKSLQWPVGSAARGNEGVASHVKRNPGSIGYVELTYGYEEVLQVGMVRNRAGEDILASPAGIAEAAKEGLSGNIPEDLRFSLVNPPGKNSYPITSLCWAVVYVDQPAGKGQLVVDFLRWATHEGQRFEEEMKYSPLPPELVSHVEKKIDQIKVAR